MNKLLIVILFALMACTDDHLVPVEPSPFGPNPNAPQVACQTPKQWDFEQFNYAQPFGSAYKWTDLKIRPSDYGATSATTLKWRITNIGTVKMAYKTTSIGSYHDLNPGEYFEYSILISGSSTCPTTITDKKINVWITLRECRQSGCSWGARLNLVSATNGHTVGVTNPGFTAIINPNSCPGGVAIVP